MQSVASLDGGAEGGGQSWPWPLTAWPKTNMSSSSRNQQLIYIESKVSIPDEELFSEAAIGCTASYFVKIIWCSRWCWSSPSFENVYFCICGRRRVAVAWYRMICLVLVNSYFPLPSGAGSAVPRKGLNLSVIILASFLVCPMLGCRHFLIDYILIPAFVQHSVMESYIDNSVSFEISDHFPICAPFNTDLYRDI